MTSKYLQAQNALLLELRKNQLFKGAAFLESGEMLETCIVDYIDQGGSLSDCMSGVPLWFLGYGINVQLDKLMVKYGADLEQPTENGASFSDWQDEQVEAETRAEIVVETADGENHFVVANGEALRKALHGIPEREVMADPRLKGIRSLLEAGTGRPACKPHMKADFDLLRSRYPNFHEVIDFVQEQVALWAVSDQQNPFRVPPMLMVGDPGVGKTRFSADIAEALGMGFHFISCASITAGFVLSGSSVQWGGGSPGRIFASMVASEGINPIIFLDEFDKLRGDHRFDGFGPMYTLLEEHTAAAFVDEAIDIPLNCTHINWLMTANETKEIPEPILSRVTVFKVPKPTPEQMRTVVKNIYDDLLAKNERWQQVFSPIPEYLVDALAETTPREARERIYSAMGKAALHSVKMEQSESINIRAEDVVSTKPRRRIGF